MGIRIQNHNQQINQDAAIRTALDDGINVREGGRAWTFPVRGTDGRIGALSVSRFHSVPVMGANQVLAVHITFSIQQIFVPSLPSLRNRAQSIRVEIRNLHFTARPAKLQLKISDQNAVARTPDGSEVSIHRGLVNDWSHANEPGRVLALAAALNIVPPKSASKAINAALASFDGPALKAVRGGLEASLKCEINDNLEPRDKRGTVPIRITFS
jgi:hypothetical protein